MDCQQTILGICECARLVYARLVYARLKRAYTTEVEHALYSWQVGLRDQILAKEGSLIEAQRDRRRSSTGVVPLEREPEPGSRKDLFTKGGDVGHRAEPVVQKASGTEALEVLHCFQCCILHFLVHSIAKSVSKYS
jgi:hypothetical protein